MSSLTQIEKMQLETILELGGGYVLNFTNEGFDSFVNQITKLSIYDTRYEKYGTSKAKRLRSFMEFESDNIVGKLIQELLLYKKAFLETSNNLDQLDNNLYHKCLNISYRLQGKKSDVKTQNNSDEDFLKNDIDEINIKNLKLDSQVLEVIEQRIFEIKKCLNINASLSVIFLCGSVLEGILLGIASNNIRAFNQSKCSPKDKETGKVKNIHEWTLNNFIDVAHDIGFIGLDVKNFSHNLRGFRNYIHPYQQISCRFNPDKHTAKISWQVLKAAMHDIFEYTNKL